MKKPNEKIPFDEDTIFPEHEGGITGELTPEELKMVLAEILREDNEYDKYAHLFRSIMKNSGSFIMNRKLASVASSLSDKFGNLSREYALKSLVEEVTLEVMKTFSNYDDLVDHTLALHDAAQKGGPNSEEARALEKHLSIHEDMRRFTEEQPAIPPKS
jgi:hypothetical protein